MPPIIPTPDHVVDALQLLLGTTLTFWWLLPQFYGEAAVNLDTDWLYRQPLWLAFNYLVTSARQIGIQIENARRHLLAMINSYLQIHSYSACASDSILRGSHPPSPTMPIPTACPLALPFCGFSSSLFSPSSISSYKCESISPSRPSRTQICYTLSIRQATIHIFAPHV